MEEEGGSGYEVTHDNFLYYVQEDMKYKFSFIDLINFIILSDTTTATVAEGCTMAVITNATAKVAAWVAA